MPTTEFFRLTTDRSVNVIELNLPDQIDSGAFDDLNEQMLGAVQGKSGGDWVLDLSGVRYMGSAMLGMVVNVRQQVKNIKGRLVLCNMSPRLFDIFRTSCMERLFTISKTRAEAIKQLR